MNIAGAHLTYCTNIHPGETWAAVQANLEQLVVAVKAKVAPDEPFGVGLRLSARAATEVDPAKLRDWLDEHGMYVFTINGFPHGTFHGTAVKEAVYRPDWLEPERVTYTNRLADVLAVLLPDGIDGTISTVPGCFRARADAGERARRRASVWAHGDLAGQIAIHLQQSIAYLSKVEDRTGKRIRLAIEPEPSCAIETIDELVAFFDAHQFGVRHLGVCLDACHAAVEFERLGESLDALRDAGIPIAKVQLGAGLRVSPVDADARRALLGFAEGVYLHQVVARDGRALVRFDDLPEALADPREFDEWRIHFHVPIFRAELGTMASTQDYLADLLQRHKQAPISTHLEVETYTWDVLPAEYRNEPIVDAVARELRWVMERLR